MFLLYVDGVYYWVREKDTVVIRTVELKENFECYGELNPIPEDKKDFIEKIKEDIRKGIAVWQQPREPSEREQRRASRGTYFG